MNRIFLTLLIIAIFSARAFGQDPDTVYQIYGNDTISQSVDGIRIEADTTLVEADFSHSPTKAIMYALVLPGLGQAYNRKFFKMPIVWAAMGGAGYIISFNTKQYKIYSKEYANNPDDLSERYLRYWRRNMELSYIALIVVYALQVVDAYVDAQLYQWDGSSWQQVGSTYGSSSENKLSIYANLTGRFAILGPTNNVYIPIVLK